MLTITVKIAIVCIFIILTCICILAIRNIVPDIKKTFNKVMAIIFIMATYVLVTSFYISALYNLLLISSIIK